MTQQEGDGRTRRRWPLVVAGIGVLLVLIGIVVGAVGSALEH
jgi:ABC-type transporter Mla subunit MlaD